MCQVLLLNTLWLITLLLLYNGCTAGVRLWLNDNNPDKQLKSVFAARTQQAPHHNDSEGWSRSMNTCETL